VSEDPGMVVSHGEVIHLKRRCLRCGGGEVTFPGEICGACVDELSQGGEP
jgi:hypothetical protein